MDTNSLNDFTNLYPVQKTLRFELKPIGKTKEWIESKGLLEQDQHRADSYKTVKRIIDHYHKHFIDNGLANLQNECQHEMEDGSSPVAQKFFSAMENYRNLMSKSDPELKKKAEKEQETLRKTIRSCFDTKLLKRLFGKELIREDMMSYLYECEQNGEQLPEDLTIDECKEIVCEFKDFTTYFTGFNTNRENMYSDEAKSTAIAYRLIHENLPKFIGNMTAWDKIKAALHDELSVLEREMTFELRGHQLHEYFEDLRFFCFCMTQNGITCYNAIIGGRSEGDKKVKGLNEYINLYNQTHKERLPKMTELYKMILSDRGTVSWLPAQFDKDTDLLESVNKAYQEIHEIAFVGENEKPSLKEIIANFSDYDLKGIYIKNDTTLTTVAKQAYDDWAIIQKGLEATYDAAHPKGTNEEKRERWIKSFDSLSIDDICHYAGSNRVISWYENLWEVEGKSAFERVEDQYAVVEDLLNTDYHGNLKEDSKSIETLKSFLDSIKELQHLAGTLKGNGDESGRDGRFYAEWERIMAVLNQITPLYNMVRNYVTQKAYSEEKFKLNFENSTLLDGWDQNKEPDNTGILFRKDGLYYLGIMDKHANKSFAAETLPCEGECYEKVDYKFFKDLTTMVPKCSTQMKEVTAHFSSSNDDYHLYNKKFAKPLTITKEVYELNNKTYDGKKKFQLDYLRNTGDKVGHQNAVSTWIQFCIDFLESYKSTIIYDINSIKKQTFTQLDTFYAEINKLLYALSFRPISEAYINKLVEDGKLYLFQIYSKDFSTFSKGTPNMHTLYWKALFSEENLKDVVYKLNGKAEVFFRKKSIRYDEEHQAHGYHYAELKEKFDYPIYKDRRYSVDKFQLHVPITMNFKSNGREYIDMQVREFAKAGGIKHIIGIDRGERHLLYLSMIDLKGNIVKQFTLNEIINEYQGQPYRTDYHALLDKKEDDRVKARKNWQTIEGIKDLKEGYLSQVIHRITSLMVEYQAIVVLEDLNFGFMRGRQKVEKQVYQKFEKMLIDKLNYLVDKKKPLDETGGILHALQLTSKFESFQKLGKQSGFLFYIPASLTSKIDPVTGFANYISCKYENADKAWNLFGKFDDIRYNSEKDYFEFVITKYTDFNPKAAGRQDWTICSYGNRIKTFRNPEKNNEWDSQEVSPTQMLKELFNNNSIDYTQNLKAQILLKKDDAKFLKELLYCLSLVLQMRNSIPNTETDYIISPVADENGHFYNSEEEHKDLPDNADANGAYNIARKGLWAVRQIMQAPDPSKVNLAMTNAEWMEFAQEKPYLE